MNQAGRRSAILIGSSQFDKEPLKAKPLKCPERDVDGMRELLASAELGAYGEVHVFKNSHHQAALDQIEEVLTSAHREDQVLIYYSGHGETDLPGRLYLAAKNTDTKKLVSTSIPVETLRTMIENSDCRKIILILDCCFGGAAGKSFVKGSVDEKLKELARGYGIYILTASTAAQTAQEREGDDYGLLTKHIIAGIKEGSAANDEGLISMDSLYRYVHRQVTAEGYQEPMRWALNVKGEDLIIARAVKTYNPQRLRALDEKIVSLRQYLLRSVFLQAFQVISDNQPKRDKAYFALLEELCEDRLSVSEFSEQWLKLSYVVPPSGGQLAETKADTVPGAVATGSAPQKTPPAKPKPPEGETPIAAKPKPPKSGIADAPEPMPSIVAETRSVVSKAVAGFTDDLNGVKLEMVYVPGGKFMMGGDKYKWEKPLHEVSVPAFYIGKFQVTQAQWKAVMGDKVKPHFKGDDDLPMENVSWEEAKEFCKKLTQMTNKAYRLPTESEWEYACRAGTTTEFAFGDSLSSKQANFDGNYPDGGAPKAVYRKKTTPVGGFDPNNFGLYDMHGNVWEWCEDVWHGSYKGAPTDGSAWLSGGDSIRRVLRGGSCYNNGNNCRSAYRIVNHPGVRLDNIGFRVVVSART